MHFKFQGLINNTFVDLFELAKIKLRIIIKQLPVHSRNDSKLKLAPSTPYTRLSRKLK